MMYSETMVANTPYEYVKQFHKLFNVPARTEPKMIEGQELELRKNLLTEEFNELMEALDEGDLSHVYKELADLIYVAYGLDLHLGSKLDDVLREVHNSNMTKVWEDGKPKYREDGKVLKPPTYRPADVDSVLGVQNG